MKILKRQRLKALALIMFIIQMPHFPSTIAVLASMLNFNETTIDKKRVKSDSVSRSVLTKFPLLPSQKEKDIAMLITY